MDTVETILFVCAAVGLGGVAGLGFAMIWCWVIPVQTHSLFWRSMGDVSRRIVTVDETAEFLALYKRLGTMVVSYTTRNVGGTLLGCLPLIILLWLVGPGLFTAWDVRTTNSGAWNPAWPLLNGLEFIFFVSFAFMTTLGLLWRVRK